ELGQAFCRWLLYDHLNITFFAHIGEIMDRDLSGQLRQCRLERKKDGDLPDYLCTDDAYGVYLAEAKGRYTSIGFKTKEFQGWRNQFDRICFKNELGQGSISRAT